MEHKLSGAIRTTPEEGLFTKRVFISTFSFQVPLRFLVRPRRKVAIVSKTTGHSMECEVTGQPRPNITWLQNGKRFTGDDRISIKPNRLDFAVIYSKDLGVYQCLADNGYEMVQSSAMLITAGRCARIKF